MLLALIGEDTRSSQTVAGLVERARSAGIALVSGSQTVTSLVLGAERLLHTAGTVITTAPVPEPIVSSPALLDGEAVISHRQVLVAMRSL